MQETNEPPSVISVLPLIPGMLPFNWVLVITCNGVQERYGVYHGKKHHVDKQSLAVFFALCLIT